MNSHKIKNWFRGSPEWWRCGTTTSITGRGFFGTSSECLSDNEQSVTTESAVLGDLFQKYVAYIKLSFFLPQVFELRKFTSFSLLEGSPHGSVVTVVLHVSSVTLH